MTEDKPKSLAGFLKKRAPIYLGLVGLFLIFAVPELTKGDLEGSLPELSAEDRQIVDVLMAYSGPDKSGFTMMDALALKIEEQYPGERIYDDKKTSIEMSVTEIDSANYYVTFDFESHKGQMSHAWNVNTESGDVDSDRPESRHIIDLVDFYD